MSDSFEVYTKHGYPIYHCKADGNTRAMAEKLAGHGVKIKLGKFSPEEDAMIKANFERMRVDYALQYQPLEYFTNSEHRKEVLEELKYINFLPDLCRGLNNRTATQVKKRFKTIYDPYYASETRVNLRKVVKEIKMNSGEYLKVSNELKVPLYQVYNAQVKILNEDKPVRPGYYYRLYDMIAGDNPYSVAKRMMDKHTNWDDVEWDEIAHKVHRSVESVQSTWKQLTKKYRHCVRKGMSSAEAVKEVFSKVRNLMREEVALFFFITASMIDPDEKYDMVLTFRGSVYREFCSVLKKKQLTAFFSGRFTEYEFAFERMRRVVRAFNDELFWQLPFELSLQAQVFVLHLAYLTNEAWNAENLRRRAFFLSKEDVARALISMLRELVPDYILPSELLECLEDWQEKASLVDLGSCESMEEALNKAGAESLAELFNEYIELYSYTYIKVQPEESCETEKEVKAEPVDTEHPFEETMRARNKEIEEDNDRDDAAHNTEEDYMDDNIYDFDKEIESPVKKKKKKEKKKKKKHKKRRISPDSEMNNGTTWKDLL